MLPRARVDLYERFHRQLIGYGMRKREIPQGTEGRKS